MGNRGASGSGGSGAAYDAVVYLEQGIYTVTVGKGGTGAGGWMNQNSPGGTNGGNTSLISFDGTRSITAGGGTGGQSWQFGASAGVGGTISVKGIRETTVYTKSNGNTGLVYGYNGANPGVGGVLPGHTYGGSGSCGGYAGGGDVRPSYNGFASITFMGYLAPNSDNSNNVRDETFFKELEYYIKV